MKTLTLVSNMVLLGLISAGILADGPEKEKDSIIPVLLAVTLLIVNIVLVGSSTVEVKAVSDERSEKKRSLYVYLKIAAIVLNVVSLVIVITGFRDASGYIIPYLKAYIILTLALSIAVITFSRQSRFNPLIRSVLYAGIIVIFLFTGTFVSFRILIGIGIRENISIAKKEFPGKAEDALLAYLADSTKSPRDRTEIAVWTLGQIRSDKALPVLDSLYNCHQNPGFSKYEIHKAIVSIESNWLGAKEKNVFGSWKRLNH